MSRRSRDPLATFNERVKMTAMFINTVALGIVGFAVLRPLTESLANWSAKTTWWLMAGLVLHAFAHYILRYLHKEDAT
ncbi:hypothetical protein ILP92_04790 [Maribius pontilimi]|uniref:Uncharacterized protein n=1 Tax=Palleronia pontilimi TaxID=1964209 RepID=A0A934MD79_9RHOB|nr:hypothetical protein [Palleronia pontilimi]MBJ3762061.1 hypothetical protein [Palleronia pontilimi]